MNNYLFIIAFYIYTRTVWLIGKNHYDIFDINYNVYANIYDYNRLVNNIRNNYILTSSEFEYIKSLPNNKLVELVRIYNNKTHKNKISISINENELSKELYLFDKTK